MISKFKLGDVVNADTSKSHVKPLQGIVVDICSNIIVVQSIGESQECRWYYPSELVFACICNKLGCDGDCCRDMV